MNGTKIQSQPLVLDHAPQRSQGALCANPTSCNFSISLKVFPNKKLFIKKKTKTKTKKLLSSTSHC